MLEFRYTVGITAPDHGEGPPRLEGVVVRYSDLSRHGRMQERFRPGSLEFLDGLIVNLQHDRRRPLARHPNTVRLLDSPTELRAEIDLPDTSDGRDCLELVKRGVLTGLSMEFEVKEQRFHAGIRNVRKAVLHGIGVVDRPSYGQSIVSIAERAMAGDYPHFARKRYWL